MSRIGNMPIDLPKGVEVKVDSDNVVFVKGPKGELQQKIDRDMIIKINEEDIVVERPTENKRHKSMHGLSRTLILNMIEGVTEGFSKKLLIEGTGYRANLQGKELVLELGYSHPINFPIPEGIEIEVPSNTEINVSGIDKQLVGEVAAKIRDYRKPEPYKGKGVKYAGERIIRKVGKTGA